MLYYPSRRRLPGSEAEMTDNHKMANTIQQLQMCQGFAAAGEDVCYVAPVAGDGEPSWEMLAEYFGLSERFTLRGLPAPDQNYSFPNYPIPDGDDQVILYWLLYEALSGGFDDGDIVFSRTLLPLRYFLLVREWTGLGRDVSVWFEQHQIDRGMNDKRLGDRFYEQLDGLVCISERQKRAVVETQPVDPETILVAPDGVDLSAYDGLSTATARERLGFDPDERVVMYTGHLYPSKGVETLVRAAADFDAHCYVVGGYDDDIARIESDVSVPDNVTFTGFVRPSEIPVYQSAADVLVATVAADSDEDYFSPLKLFEYMAAGKPIVVSSRPEFGEVLTDGENAVFVEPSDVDELARAVQKLLSDPDRRATLGGQASEDARQYDWRVRAERILDAVRQTKPSGLDVGIQKR